MAGTTNGGGGGAEGREGVDFDVLIVGAGFGGLYMLHKCHELGLRARILEAGAGVGGTWYWNRYPGARCDIESLEYSYQFDEALQQEWSWSERYSPQAEILEYLNHVADRFDLRPDIQLDTRVRSAHFDDDQSRWTLETEDGERLRARFCVMATGCLSAANHPEFEGLDSFEGRTVHTSSWPEEGIDFTGQRVGVIGTGSSAVQSIPIIAGQAEKLTVFQRTPTYTVPAGNGPMDREVEREVKQHYPRFRAEAAMNPFGIHWEDGPPTAAEVPEEERRQRFQAYWDVGGLYFLGAYQDLMLNPESNETAARFIREKIADIVDDPEVARRLTPEQPVGCKRLCADTGYYETFNRENVELVDLGDAPIERVSPKGIVAGGHEHPLDCIVFATGFDAMTGSLSRIDIRGRADAALNEKWAAGPLTYLGLGVSGFPNLFIVAGPGSPSVLSSMVPSIEQHVEWVADCIEYMRAHSLRRIEATPEAQNEWVAHVNEIADTTLYPGCSSWYLGANIEGKPRVFMPYVGFPTYVEKCDQVARAGYSGFALEG